jgi:hypothetical protein
MAMAIALNDSATAVNPLFWPAYWKNGQMQNSIEYYDKAIKAEPNSFIARETRGLYYQSDYAYTASTGTVDECVTLDGTYAATVGSWVDLNTDGNSDNTEDLLRMRLTNTGPVVTCLDETIWSSYVSGTISNCDFNTVNHCVQVVGLFYSSATDEGFYKIRNVWGSDWGIDGYVSVTYGSNICGIANNPTYVDATKQ